MEKNYYSDPFVLCVVLICNIPSVFKVVLFSHAWQINVLMWLDTTLISANDHF